MPKMSTYVLSTSRKHTTGSLVIRIGGCCDSVVLTAPCYWPSCMYEVDRQSHSQVNVDLTVGSCRIDHMLFADDLIVHSLNRVFNM